MKLPVGRPINEMSIARRDELEGLFYFGSDDSDVAEIGGGRGRPPGLAGGRERESLAG